jgi:spore maturation protein CgeB
MSRVSWRRHRGFCKIRGRDSPSLKILLIGLDEEQHLGRIFRRSLERLGHRVCFVDEALAYGWLDARPAQSLVWRFRRNLPTRVASFRRELLRIAKDFSPDLVLSLKGSYLNPETLEALKQTTSALLINFATDDSFNDSASTPCIRPSLPLWDVLATPRRHTIPDLQRHCKGSVIYLPFAYDPEAHFPQTQITSDEERIFGSDLVFIGVCDADRVETLKAVAKQEEVALRLYGGGRRYQLVPELRRCYQGFAVGRNYRLALGCSKIALSLNRKANRDTHVMRTFEIPACGCFLLAERTDEQCEMFEEDREAVFFTGLDELLDKICFYLKNDDARHKIARAGFQRVTSGENTYCDRLSTLLERVGVRSPTAA